MLLEARSKHALVPLRVFRNRSLSVADVAALLIGAGMFAMWFYVSLYLQQVLGFDALKAGFSFVPGSAMIVLGTMVATRACRIGPRPLLLVGPLVAAIGLAWLSRFPADGSYTADVLGPLMLLTFGMGLAMTPLAVAGTAGMPRHEAGLASGLINTSRRSAARSGWRRCRRSPPHAPTACCVPPTARSRRCPARSPTASRARPSWEPGSPCSVSSWRCCSSQNSRPAAGGETAHAGAQDSLATTAA